MNVNLKILFAWNPHEKYRLYVAWYAQTKAMINITKKHLKQYYISQASDMI